MIKKVAVYIDDKDLDFLKWLAKYDNEEDKKNGITDTKWTVNKEINCLAGIKIKELMDSYKEEGLYNK